jgi:hypothetical protein
MPIFGLNDSYVIYVCLTLRQGAKIIIKLIPMPEQGKYPSF